MQRASAHGFHSKDCVAGTCLSYCRYLHFPPMEPSVQQSSDLTWNLESRLSLRCFIEFHATAPSGRAKRTF